MTNLDASPRSVERPVVPVKLFSIAVGLLITNMFALQVLVGPISESLGIAKSLSGLVATIPLLGYAAGLFFLVPLADLLENRGLVLGMLSLVAAALLGITFAGGGLTLFVLLLLVGACYSAVQILIPIAAGMVEPEERGRVIGDIMSGLMVGILLSRPIASLLAGTWGWKSYYIASAGATLMLLGALAAKLPSRHPNTVTSYGALIASMWSLFRNEPVLRSRSISAAIVMVAFNFFWTTITFVLSGSPLHLGQIGIALFALVGTGGAITTPIVGRLSDKGFGERVTAVSHLVMMGAFGLAALSLLGSPYMMLVGLGLSAFLLDVGVLGDQTVGRYMVNLLNPEARARINGIFVGVFFLGGAIGSALSGALWVAGGWKAICAASAGIAALASVFRMAR